MVANLIEGGEILNQQMLQNGALINVSRGSSLPGALGRTPLFVRAGAPEGQTILEIGGLFQQNIQITGLIDVQLGGHQGPQGVIHPDPGNAVAVGDEIPVTIADDGGVGAVHANAAKVLFDHLPHTLRVHDE